MISFISLFSAWWLSEQTIHAWVSAFLDGLRALLIFSPPGNEVVTSPEHDGRSPRQHAPAQSAAPPGFTNSVMTRVRSLPAPTPALPSFVLGHMPSPVATRGRIGRFGLLFGAFGFILFILLVLLVASGLIAAAHPALAMLLMGMLVNLVVLLLAMLQALTQAVDGVAANAWLGVPALLSLLGIVLLAWSRIASRVVPLMLEV
ncbi:MAG: hypothetical protein IVW57_08670 [Ktedonobacterales bacterium]|nr:hypothetical protein [Ktedonobacterales bacterium]